MWEGAVEGMKRPVEENRLGERAMRWRGKHPWNNARLGNKRERGLQRSKRWAIWRGVCLKRTKRHCVLVLRRIFVFRCLKIIFKLFLWRNTLYFIKSFVLLLISNRVTNQWHKSQMAGNLLEHSISASLMGLGWYWHNILKRTAHPNMNISSCHLYNLKCIWFSFLHWNTKQIFCGLSSSFPCNKNWLAALKSFDKRSSIKLCVSNDFFEFSFLGEQYAIVQKFGVYVI